MRLPSIWWWGGGRRRRGRRRWWYLQSWFQYGLGNGLDFWLDCWASPDGCADPDPEIRCHLGFCLLADSGLYAWLDTRSTFRLDKRFCLYRCSHDWVNCGNYRRLGTRFYNGMYFWECAGLCRW